MNIEDLKKLPDKAMIMSPGLIAICTDVYERRTGTSQHGDWSLQPLSLKDNSGEIKAIIWNRPDLAALKGKNIHISALESEINGRKGWSGCTVEDNKYQGKVYKQINASGNFLLEEYRPTKANNGADGHPEGALQTPSLPTWDDYSMVAKAAHRLALELEPDPASESGFPTDRARARVVLVATILIAYGKKDFQFRPEDDDIPF